MEIKQTMKAMSIMEKENKLKLERMIPNNVFGRYQILNKLKELTVDIDEVVIKSVNRIPSIIRRVESFFSPDGFWSGNFIAYGIGVNNKELLLWDDMMVDDIIHYQSMVDTQYVKEKLSSDNPATLIVSKNNCGKHVLEVYCYLP